MTSRQDDRVRPEHVPLGDPCQRCKLPASMHRLRSRKRFAPEHFPLGDPCKRCFYPASKHRPRYRQRESKPEHEPQGDPCRLCGQPPSAHRDRNKIRDEKYDDSVYVGMDGEGQGRENHRYVLLSASDTSKKYARYISDPKGLSTVDCLDFILGYPNRVRIFAYSFGYDLTMMLRDLSNEHLYYLFRPDLRKGRTHGELGPIPIEWNGYTINLQGTRFTVSKDDTTRIIWDIWKFYQCRFTKALTQWSIGTKEEIEFLDLMKSERDRFDQYTITELLPYNYMECAYLALLAEKLVNAHIDAGLKLRSFYGAGSTGGAILKQMNVKACMADPPEEMQLIVPYSFFGGRFENSMIGLMPRRVYSRDIASAYPYQEYFLPCLLHARWERITDRNKLVTMTNRNTALVRYRLHKPEKKKLWGPFPFRLADGSICFPESCGGGWVWAEEYLAGEAIFPNVEFVEAWNLHSECDCHPFKKIAHYYLERLRIGKEGAGFVFKFGPNATYGKLAQSIGDGPYTNWVWASLITSNTRAHLLRAMGAHSDIDNVLLLATDGMHTLEDIQSEIPKDTGTAEGAKAAGKEPLGGWEVKKIEGGVFYARPGVYFPLEVEEENVRGRGLGRKTLYESRKLIMDAWEATKDTEDPRVTIGNVVRFIGAKSAITFKEQSFMRSLDYGQWKKRPVELSFSPLPKRAKVDADGRLTLRNFSMDLMSEPYKKAIGPDAAISLIRKQELEEQPDLTYHLEE